MANNSCTSDRHKGVLVCYDDSNGKCPLCVEISMKKNRWIPISQGFPLTIEGVSKFVLVTTSDKCVCFARYFKSKKNGKFWSTAAMNRIVVVAWMPVPEPYAEKGGE